MILRSCFSFTQTMNNILPDLLHLSLHECKTWRLAHHFPSLNPTANKRCVHVDSFLPNRLFVSTMGQLDLSYSLHTVSISSSYLSTAFRRTILKGLTKGVIISCRFTENMHLRLLLPYSSP
jgi:hypothetical protein